MMQRPEYGGGEIWFDDVLIRKGRTLCLSGTETPESGEPALAHVLILPFVTTIPQDEDDDAHDPVDEHGHPDAEDAKSKILG